VRPLRGAVIGLGVGEKHAEALRANPHVELIAICDHDPAKLSEVAGRFPGVRQIAQDTLILDDPAIDLVCIASYDNFHFAQTMRAHEHDKHVFVEKP
jgi:myo-inositol 2-dehydrogenase/D-chiro-inositol 1-dehydrogenase